MEKTPWKRITALLACAIMCIGMMFGSAGTACAADGSQAGIAIQILLPANWATKSTSAKICITDDAGRGFSSVQVKTGQDGVWKDITNTLERRESRCYGVVELTDNCIVFVRVTGHDGQFYEESRYIACFDRTPPAVQGRIDGDALQISCSDDLSGVASVSVNGKRYDNAAGGALNLSLKEIGSSEKIVLQAADCAGNLSQTVELENSNFKKAQTPAANAPAVSAKPAIPPAKTTPAAAKPTAGAVSSDSEAAKKNDPAKKGSTLTPDGQGTVVDNVTDEDSKEFFTISTQDENTFYLVIDRQRDNENVYLLDTVKESDLLSMAEKDKEAEQPPQSAVPEPEPVCICKEKCAPGEIDTKCEVCTLAWKDCTGEEPEPAEEGDAKAETPESSGSGTLILVAIAALAAGAAGYYVKIYKPRKALDDAEDLDELLDTEEETVNEDDGFEPQNELYGDLSEPEYSDEYEYEEPEDEP